MKRIWIPLILSVALVGSGCDTTQQAGQKETLGAITGAVLGGFLGRSEEHTSELQSHHDLVCRLLLGENN